MMPPGGEQSRQKRRSKANTGGQDPTPLVYPKAPKDAAESEKSTTPPQTDAYHIDEGLDDDLRSHSSAVRYDSLRTTQAHRAPDIQPPLTTVPRRQTRNIPAPVRKTAPQTPALQVKKNVHWLLPVGLGMLAMLVLWVTGSWLLAWGVQRYDDVRYGYPRTYQTDAVVGHGDSAAHPSHFMAMNLNRQAIVIEFMGGDPQKAKVYVAPVYIAGSGGDLAPVTVEFRDVTGDGKPDMIIHIHLPNQDQVSVFINTGKDFRPANGNDKINI